MSDRDDWDGFVAAITPEWVDNPTTRELLQLTSDKDLTMAIWACLRSQSLEWMQRAVPAFDGRRPIDMLSNEAVKDRLRWVLISNPWW